MLKATLEEKIESIVINKSVYELEKVGDRYVTKQELTAKNWNFS